MQAINQELLFTLQKLAQEQKVVILFLKSGDRNHLKLIEVNDKIVIGEARCLYHNYEIGRKIHMTALEEENKEDFQPGKSPAGLTMADAVERFGSDAHRFRFYIDLSEVYAVVEDLDDAFDETPYFTSVL